MNKNPDSETAEAPFEQEIRAACNDLADFLVEKNRTYGNSIIEPMSVFAKRLDRLALIDTWKMILAKMGS